MKNLIILICMVCLSSSCSTNSISYVSKGKGNPPCIIYKTKKDYSQNVPVLLNEDRNKIIGYPSVKDVFYKGKYGYPIKLKDNYLLDVMGLSKFSAYTSYTLEEYSKLSKVPTLEELTSKIIDKDPFVEMYWSDEVEMVNAGDDVANLFVEYDFVRVR